MHFRFAEKRGRKRPGEEENTFTICRLWSDTSGGATEITHLLDRTYRYRSARELKWHLAERFGLPVEAVTLERIPTGERRATRHVTAPVRSAAGAARVPHRASDARISRARRLAIGDERLQIGAPINDSKGGDPVSHCHELRSSAARTWILASGEIHAA